MTAKSKLRKPLTPADHKAAVEKALAFSKPRIDALGREARAFSESIQKQVAEIKSPGMRKSALS